jgi:hypothetical protein
MDDTRSLVRPGHSRLADRHLLLINDYSEENPSKIFNRPSLRYLSANTRVLPVCRVYWLSPGPSGCSFWENKVYEIRVKDDRINAYRVIKGENSHDVEAIRAWTESR